MPKREIFEGGSAMEKSGVKETGAWYKCKGKSKEKCKDNCKGKGRGKRVGWRRVEEIIGRIVRGKE